MTLFVLPSFELRLRHTTLLFWLRNRHNLYRAHFWVLTWHAFWAAFRLSGTVSWMAMRSDGFSQRGGSRSLRKTLFCESQDRD
jgi:hypothetical protein